MKELVKRLLKARYPYNPLVRVEIYKDNLLYNLREFQKIAPEGRVAPVLKSNAYGHGLVSVAKILDKENLPFLIVDSYFEALALRTNSIHAPLLIIGYTPASNIYSNRLKHIAFNITNIETLEDLSRNLKRKTEIHLKIDTGMSRQGILLSQVPKAVELIKKNKKIILAGICSHFAESDAVDPKFTELQISRWNSLVETFLKEFPNLSFYHISNTGGHFYNKKIKANISRLGLGLYGINQNAPVDILVKLKPVLEVKTVISGIKKISKGDVVGYGKTFKAEKDMTIATLPLGYFECLDRRLSNKGFVKIKDTFVPIIGRISMNITTIDVSGIPGLKVDDEVVVISKNAGDKNSVEHISLLCGTIPYEISVYVEGSLHRTVI